MSKLRSRQGPQHFKPSHAARCLEDFEYSVFLNASYFSVMKIIPRELRKREEYNTFPAAIRAARGWRGPHGRRALVYAVTPPEDANHFVQLPRERWPELLKLWEARHLKRKRAA